MCIPLSGRRHVPRVWNLPREWPSTYADGDSARSVILTIIYARAARHGGEPVTIHSGDISSPWLPVGRDPDALTFERRLSLVHALTSAT